jgi:hypothetical protein
VRVATCSRRGHAARGVQAHVERLVALEREAAAGGLELPGRHTEIEEHGAGLANAVLGGHGAEVGETGVGHTRARPEAGQPGTGLPHRLRVGVETEQAHVLAAPLQHRLRVSAHAHRPVDHPAPVTRPQQKRDLVHEDGNVNR